MDNINIEDNNLFSDNSTILEENLSDPFNKFCNEIVNNLKQIKNDINKNISNIKKIHKIVVKLTQKQIKRSNTKVKKPSGFTKLNYIPQELKKLLSISEDIITRPKLTGKLYDYIDANNLKHEKNGRIMRVNDELASALRLSQDEIEKINNSSSDNDKSGLNFFSAQKWIKKLYEKDKKEKNNISPECNSINKFKQKQIKQDDTIKPDIKSDITSDITSDKKFKKPKILKKSKPLKEIKDEQEDEKRQKKMESNKDEIIIITKPKKLKTKSI
jgi:hypothetical protein